MSELTDKIKKKLGEYGIKIYDHYQGEIEDEYIFLAEDMVIFARDKNKEVGISFQATTKPDIVANNLLILQEVEEIESIDIMESFVFNEKRQMISGDEAFNLIIKSIKSQAVKEYAEHLCFREILEKSNCHEC